MDPDSVKLLLSSFVCQKDLRSCDGVQEPRQPPSDRGDQRQPPPLHALSTQPNNRQAFHDRIKTFKSVTWFAKPHWLSPPHCARYGWSNVGLDMLQCTSCRAFLSGKMPSAGDPQVYTACCQRLEDSLRSAHNTLCPWSSHPSPESFLTPMLCSDRETVTDIQARVHSVRSLGDVVPVLSQDVSKTLGLSETDIVNLHTVLFPCLTEEWIQNQSAVDKVRSPGSQTGGTRSRNIAVDGPTTSVSESVLEILAVMDEGSRDSKISSEASFHTAFDPDDMMNMEPHSTVIVEDVQNQESSAAADVLMAQDKAALVMALCGWQKQAGSLPQLHCTLCDRHVGLWSYHSFHSQAEPQSEEEEEEEEEEEAAAEEDGEEEEEGEDKADNLQQINREEEGGMEEDGEEKDDAEEEGDEKQEVEVEDDQRQTGPEGLLDGQETGSVTEHTGSSAGTPRMDSDSITSVENIYSEDSFDCSHIRDIEMIDNEDDDEDDDVADVQTVVYELVDNVADTLDKEQSSEISVPCVFGSSDLSNVDANDIVQDILHEMVDSVLEQSDSGQSSNDGMSSECSLSNSENNQIELVSIECDTDSDEAPDTHDTVNDDVRHDTVSNDVRHDTVSDDVRHDTVSDDVRHDTVSDDVRHDTVNDDVRHDPDSDSDSEYPKFHHSKDDMCLVLEDSDEDICDSDNIIKSHGVVDSDFRPVEDSDDSDVISQHSSCQEMEGHNSDQSLEVEHEPKWSFGVLDDSDTDNDSTDKESDDSVHEEHCLPEEQDLQAVDIEEEQIRENSLDSESETCMLGDDILIESSDDEDVSPEDSVHKTQSVDDSEICVNIGHPDVLMVKDTEISDVGLQAQDITRQDPGNDLTEVTSGDSSDSIKNISDEQQLLKVVEFPEHTDEAEDIQSTERMETVCEEEIPSAVSEHPGEQSMDACSTSQESQPMEDVETVSSEIIGSVPGEHGEDALDASPAPQDEEIPPKENVETDPEIMGEEESVNTITPSQGEDLRSGPLKRKQIDGESTSNKCSSGPLRKKRKPKVVRSFFCPVNEHRSWCPWVTLVKPSEDVMDVMKEGRTQEDSTDREPDRIAGWRRYIDHLLNNKAQPPGKLGHLVKTTPEHKSLRNIRHILDQWTGSPNISKRISTS